MKAYLFNVETGVYEGEDFEDDGMLQYEDGMTPIPPPDYEHGQVPVFDRSRNAWSVIPTAMARQLLSLDNGANAEKSS